LKANSNFSWVPAHLRNFRKKPSYRFAVLNWGTRGDIQPYVDLGAELVRRGHRVTCTARAPYRSLIEGDKIGYFEMHEDGTENLLRSLAASRSVPEMLNVSSSYSRGITRQQCESFWEASRGADVILSKVITTAPAIHVAECRGIPIFLEHFDPGFLPTGSYCFLDGRIQDRGGLFNRFMSRFMLLSLAVSLSGKINDWRKSLGMPADRFGTRNRSAYLSRFPAFVAWSHHLLERPPDWPEWVVQTGWWRSPSKSRVSPRLRAFIDGGPPPVYFGFGSWEIHDKTAMTEMLLEVARRTGNRAVLLRATVDDRLNFPEGIFVDRDLPHDWLFPRVKAVVHHGGTGTVGAVTMAGVPAIVIPGFPTQAAWGYLSAEKKIGMVLKKADLRVETLTAAVLEMDDPGIRERARAIGIRTRQDGGVNQAADEIERRLREIPD
jgi:sterol 3beta-glucosyltransferase